MKRLLNKEMICINGGGWTGLIPWVYKSLKPAPKISPATKNFSKFLDDYDNAWIKKQYYGK